MGKSDEMTFNLKIQKQFLADKLGARRAGLIERDVQARYFKRQGISASGYKMDRLIFQRRSDGVRAREFSVDVAEIFEKDGSWLAGYCLKYPHSRKEPGCSREVEVSALASKREVGPRFFDYANGLILEEYFPHHSRIESAENQERISSDQTGFGRDLSRTFLALAGLTDVEKGGYLLDHGDYRTEHHFLLSDGGNYSLKFIDWGRGNIYRLGSSFRPAAEWLTDHFGTFHRYFQFGSAVIWKEFLNGLANISAEMISQAYIGFLQKNVELLRGVSWDVGGARKKQATEFFELSVACGSVELDLGPFGDLFVRFQGLKGEELRTSLLRALS